jgi:hypothetical protein
MRLALVGLVALVSCSDGFKLKPIDDSRVITVPGGSCGHWQETTSNPATITFVTATCGNGMLCQGIAYAMFDPGDVGGREFHTCVPANALTCDISANPCPDPFACSIGYNMPSTGACIHECTTDADCPDKYQLCDSGG